MQPNLPRPPLRPDRSRHLRRKRPRHLPRLRRPLERPPRRRRRHSRSLASRPGTCLALLLPAPPRRPRRPAQRRPQSPRQDRTTSRQTNPDNFYLCTQNVDDLHERAGSRRIHHMHGSLFQSRCTRCNEPFPDHVLLRRPQRPPHLQNLPRHPSAPTSSGSAKSPSTWMPSTANSTAPPSSSS